MAGWTVVTSVFVLLSCAAHSSHGWGRVFTQFSPQLLDNYGYSGSRQHHYRPSAQSHSFQGDEEELVEELLEEEEEMKSRCRGARCVSNEQCCPQYLCVETEEMPKSMTGTCMPKFELREGLACNSDKDCGASLTCVQQVGGQKVCEKHLIGTKAFYEDCRTSTECDVTRGLCCQVMRQHRQTPRKACLYFSDPLMCIGHVPMEAVNVKNDASLMSSEKRIIGGSKELKHLEN